MPMDLPRRKNRGFLGHDSSALPPQDLQVSRPNPGDVLARVAAQLTGDDPVVGPPPTEIRA